MKNIALIGAINILLLLTIGLLVSSLHGWRYGLIIAFSLYLLMSPPNVIQIK